MSVAPMISDGAASAPTTIKPTHCPFLMNGDGYSAKSAAAAAPNIVAPIIAAVEETAAILRSAPFAFNTNPSCIFCPLC